jgi:hypothetical protein
MTTFLAIVGAAALLLLALAIVSSVRGQMHAKASLRPGQMMHETLGSVHMEYDAYVIILDHAMTLRRYPPSVEIAEVVARAVWARSGRWTEDVCNGAIDPQTALTEILSQYVISTPAVRTNARHPLARELHSMARSTPAR